MHKHYLCFLFLLTSSFDAFTLPYPSVFSSPKLLNNKEFIPQNKYVCMYQLCGNFIFRIRLDRPVITKTEANIRVNMALSIPSTPNSRFWPLGSLFAHLFFFWNLQMLHGEGARWNSYNSYLDLNIILHYPSSLEQGIFIIR